MKGTEQNTNLNIRISKDLKSKFISVTKGKGASYSALIRSFITDYINSECK